MIKKEQVMGPNDFGIDEDAPGWEVTIQLPGRSSSYGGWFASLRKAREAMNLALAGGDPREAGLLPEGPPCLLPFPTK